MGNYSQDSLTTSESEVVGTICVIAAILLFVVGVKMLSAISEENYRRVSGLTSILEQFFNAADTSHHTAGLIRHKHNAGLVI